jgi:glycosyltransferase involved in cell wall biosynthesis
MLRPDQPVSVVIPALNEEDAVAAEVKAIHDVLRTQDIVHEIVVVDDGSEDRTAERAAKAGARVLRHLENRGYGAALKAGIRAAKHDIIVITDADGTYPPEQIPELLDKLDEADMAVGARVGTNVRIPLIRRPAKWMLGQLAQYIAGRAIPDLNSGLRAFHRDCVQQYFSILSNRFSFTTTVTLALFADDYRIIYHPIDYYARVGKSKITPRHFMDFVILVLRMAMLFQPLRVFLPLSFGFGFLGSAKVVYDIISFFPRTSAFDWSIFYQPVLSTSAILSLLISLQLLLVGLVADGVMRRIAQHDLSRVSSRAVTVSEADPEVATLPRLALRAEK